MNLHVRTPAGKIAFSALVVALYVAVMATSAGFAFGQYQVRIATSLYALAGIFLFLVVPLGFANFLSNALLGGLGPLDMIGGVIVGLLTSGAIALARRSRFAPLAAFAAIALIPGLGVPVWLSVLLHVPYSVLAASLLVGQVIAGAFGALLLAALRRRIHINQED